MDSKKDILIDLKTIEKLAHSLPKKEVDLIPLLREELDEQAKKLLDSYIKLGYKPSVPDFKRYLRNNEKINENSYLYELAIQKCSELEKVPIIIYIPKEHQGKKVDPENYWITTLNEYYDHRWADELDSTLDWELQELKSDGDTYRKFLCEVPFIQKEGKS